MSPPSSRIPPRRVRRPPGPPARATAARGPGSPAIDSGSPPHARGLAGGGAPRARQDTSRLPAAGGQIVLAHHDVLDASSDTLSVLLPRLVAVAPNCRVLDLSHSHLALDRRALVDPTHPLNRGLAQLSALAWLETVAIRRSGLQAIPVGLLALGRLRRLDLGDNRLVELPRELGQLSGLQELIVDNNQLTRLPPALAKLPHLEKVLAAHNPLAEVPAALAERAARGHLRLVVEPRAPITTPEGPRRAASGFPRP